MLTKKIVYFSFFLSLIINDISLPQITIRSNTFNSGGTSLTNSIFRVFPSIGITMVGKNANASLKNYAGFWYTYNADLITRSDIQNNIPTRKRQRALNYARVFLQEKINETGRCSRHYMRPKVVI